MAGPRLPAPTAVRGAAGRSVVRRGRAATSAAFFAQGFGFAVVLTHLGTFKTRWGIDDLVVTVIMFVVALLAAVGSALAAWLAGRLGSGAALRVGLVGLAAGLVIAGLAPAFGVFCVGIGLYGVGLGCVDATTNMQAVACEALQGRSILTSFHGAWSAGGILGALETSGTGSWGWSVAASLTPVAVVPLVVAAAPFLPLAVGRSPIGPSPIGPSPIGPSPIGPSSIEPSQTEPSSIGRETGRSAGNSAPGRAIPWRALTMLGIAIVLFYVADSATSSWSTIYLSDVLLAGAGLAPIGYAAYQATSLLSRLAGDHLVRRVGPVTVVRAAAGVGAAGLLAVVLARTPWLAIAGFAVLGIGIAVVAPLTFAAAGRLASVDADGNPVADERSRRVAADAIVARINQFNYLGFVLGGVLTGLVASGSTMREGFIVPLVGICLIMPLARVFAARRNGRVEATGGRGVPRSAAPGSSESVAPGTSSSVAPWSGGQT